VHLKDVQPAAVGAQHLDAQAVDGDASPRLEGARSGYQSPRRVEWCRDSSERVACAIPLRLTGSASARRCVVDESIRVATMRAVLGGHLPRPAIVGLETIDSRYRLTVLRRNQRGHYRVSGGLATATNDPSGCFPSSMYAAPSQAREAITIDGLRIQVLRADSRRLARPSGDRLPGKA